MFDIGWSELLIIGIVALIAIGPKELPTVLRTVGQYMGKIRRMASEFQGQFQDAMREAEMADVKKQFDEMESAASDLTHFDPMADVQKEIDQALADESAASPAAETATPEHERPQHSTEIPPPLPDTGGAASHADLEPAPEAPQPKAGSGA
jgi:sec-independent protein translocase protein TatB